MRSHISFALLFAAALLLGPASMASAARLPKVEICHVPPGNPGNAHLIQVSENALRAHLAHGDFAVGEPCFEGVGACRTEGVAQCDPEDTCSAVPGGPSDEVCNGLDDDCDGVVDDDPIDVGECTVGVGECAADSVEICTDEGSVCDAVPGDPPEPVETSCQDGRDNDCDGRIDSEDSDCPAVCCDPALEPGVAGNPVCFEGHACCGDGTWRCNLVGGTDACGGPVGEVCEPLICTDDVKTCPDGSVVGRNPNDDCEFFPCIGIFCTNDVMQCPDGSFVGRDPNDGCQFFPCP